MCGGGWDEGGKRWMVPDGRGAFGSDAAGSPRTPADGARENAGNVASHFPVASVPATIRKSASRIRRGRARLSDAVVFLDAHRDDALEQAYLLRRVRHGPNLGQAAPEVLERTEQLLGTEVLLVRLARHEHQRA